MNAFGISILLALASACIAYPIGHPVNRWESLLQHPVDRPATEGELVGIQDHLANGGESERHMERVGELLALKNLKTGDCGPNFAELARVARDFGDAWESSAITEFINEHIRKHAEVCKPYIINIVESAVKGLQSKPENVKVEKHLIVDKEMDDTNNWPLKAVISDRLENYLVTMSRSETKKTGMLKSLSDFMKVFDQKVSTPCNDALNRFGDMLQIYPVVSGKDSQMIDLGRDAADWTKFAQRCAFLETKKESIAKSILYELERYWTEHPSAKTYMAEMFTGQDSSKPASKRI